MKYNHFKTYKVTLTALSPVFIGDGGTLNKINYVFDGGKKLLQVVDERRWAKLLQQDTMLLDAFAGDCAAGRLTDFRAWAASHNVIPPYRYTMSVYKEEEIKQGQGYQGGFKKTPTMNDVKTFIKSPDGNPYIPGSSLKGAIRTALFNERVKGRDSLSEKDVFGGIGESVFECLSISDSTELPATNLYVGQRLDQPVNGKPHPISVYAEFLKPQSKLSFTMTLYHSRGDKKPLTVDEIKSALKNFTNTQTRLLKKINTAVSLEGANLCLGGHAGFFSKTTVYDQLGEVGALDFLINDHFRRRAPKHHKHDTIDKEYRISPHTLKLTKYNGVSYLIGWCRLDIEEC